MDRAWLVHLAWFAVVCLSVWATRALGRLSERADGRRAVARGKRGEQNAERFLKRLGYRIVARQVGGAYQLTVDGSPHETRVQADLLVERDGQRLVAEVKTGAQATRIEHEGTRRQLLEYQLAFGGDAVLLVDGERGEVRAVSFPIASVSALSVRRGTFGGVWLLAACLVALVGFALHGGWFRGVERGVTVQRGGER